MSKPPQFQITPDQVELDKMPRVLRFFPCTNTRPGVLTQSQVDQFNRDGYLTGHLTHRQTDQSEQSVLGQAINDAQQYGSVVDILLRAGEVSIHSDLLLHGSKANHSDHRRCGLTLRYCPADVRAGMDWDQKGVLVCGADAAGHWVNAHRPRDE